MSAQALRRGFGQAKDWNIFMHKAADVTNFYKPNIHFARQDPSRIPYDPNASLEEQIFSSANVSKRHLHTDYLDALLLHSPLSLTQNYGKHGGPWRP